jgi:photosystem II stability/assembly factor-like uncharacterized protein
MKKCTFFLFFSCLILAIGCVDSESVIQPAIKQVIQVKTPSLAHFRGVQAVSDDVVWVSGTGGTVLLTENGGKKWKDVTVPACDSLDFRDIHALDAKRAWVMSSGNGARIYHTKNSGKTWVLQFEDANPKVFLDGMDFSDELNGVAYGDPVSESMDILLTSNGGETWTRIPSDITPVALKDEAGFAASGTGVVYSGNTIWMATGGGEISRILKSEDKGQNWEVFMTPILGGAGKGIFSMAMKDELNGVAVGGDYVDSTQVKFNCAFTADGGEKWELVEINGPLGYRSCVVITKTGLAIACGRTGIDSSVDFKNWTSISEEGYFTCDAGEELVWLAGRSGRVAKMRLE